MRSLREDVLHEYDYDPVDRLTRWQRGPDRFEAYTYDRVGNRIELQDERGIVTDSYDQANRLLEELRTFTDGGTTTTSYSWDPNGNLTQEAISTGSVTTYTWDALNRLTRLDDASGAHSYGYNPMGIRVRETNGSQTTRFLHAGEDIVASYQGGTVETYYTHGPGIDEPWAQVDADAEGASTDSRLAYLHRDGLGSVTAISNPNAQLRGTTTYAAFGQVEQAEGLTSRYGYTSRELDPTGLMYYRARYYQPSVGRFSSTDRFFINRLLPLTLNKYLYAKNNPMRYIDPSGRAAVSDLFSEIRNAPLPVELILWLAIAIALVPFLVGALVAAGMFIATVLTLLALATTIVAVVGTILDVLGAIVALTFGLWVIGCFGLVTHRGLIADPLRGWWSAPHTQVLERCIYLPRLIHRPPTGNPRTRT